jgi:hypothetical protein
MADAVVPNQNVALFPHGSNHSGAPTRVVKTRNLTNGPTLEFFFEKWSRLLGGQFFEPPVFSSSRVRLKQPTTPNELSIIPRGLTANFFAYQGVADPPFSCLVSSLVV